MALDFIRPHKDTVYDLFCEQIEKSFSYLCAIVHFDIIKLSGDSE